MFSIFVYLDCSVLFLFLVVFGFLFLEGGVLLCVIFVCVYGGSFDMLNLKVVGVIFLIWELS